MPNKTVMQQAKEKVLSLRNEAHVNCLEEFKNACNQVLNIIEPLLEQEKKQIIDAWLDGGSTLSAKNATQYYNQRYNINV
jgi:hypothetical protein